MGDSAWFQISGHRSEVWEMAKIRRRKIRWDASFSSDIVGYKVYWAVGGEVNYDSDFVKVGMCEEIILPDGIPSFPLTRDKIEIGVTAVNEIGNESDMAKLSAPFQFSLPESPANLVMENLQDFYVSDRFSAFSRQDSQKPN
jgi:hypothetical protein